MVNSQSVTDDSKFILYYFIEETISPDKVADGKEHKECNYYPLAFLPPMQETISAFL